MKRFFFILTLIVAVPLLFSGGFVLWLQLTSWQPKPVELLHETKAKPLAGKQFSILTWNIGYAGLGKEMDFFYEGGEKVRPGENEFRQYLQGIVSELKKHDTADFVFLQEIDLHSKRSYFTDELKVISEQTRFRHHYFGKNYDSRYVPVPVTGPMGRVVSGVAVFAKHEPARVSRIDFGTRFSWPKQLVMLQRCFLLMRYPLENGHDLVLINTHNSVFDEEGFLRRQELKMLEDTMNHELAKGNYVIAGGDWNMNPSRSGQEWLNNISGDRMTLFPPPPEDSLFRGWQIVYDPSAPTNRNVNMPYRKGITGTTILDYFVVSPNLIIKRIKTLPLEFRYSDHNPVFCVAEINEE